MRVYARKPRQKFALLPLCNHQGLYCYYYYYSVLSGFVWTGGRHPMRENNSIILGVARSVEQPRLLGKGKKSSRPNLHKHISFKHLARASCAIRHLVISMA
jgi:hypothetical protein